MVFIKKLGYFTLIWILILVIYYPLYSYINNKILHETIKHALEEFVSSNCQQKIQVTGFQIHHIWAQEYWTAITSDPNVNDLRGAIIANEVSLFKPDSLHCNGAESYKLNRADGKFYPMFKTIPPPPDGETAFKIWLFLLFGGIVTVVTTFAYVQNKKQEKDTEAN